MSQAWHVQVPHHTFGNIPLGLVGKSYQPPRGALGRGCRMGEQEESGCVGDHPGWS